jgi:MraZ protein
VGKSGREWGNVPFKRVFRGANKITLDAKGRMVMPTRYRERLQERCQGRIVITVDRDHCLLLYPFPDWEEIERKLMRLPSLDRRARRLQRLMVGHATHIELDGHGRLLVPPKLREFAKLERNAVLIGQGVRFELWDERLWDAKCDEWFSAEEEDDTLPPELGSLAL